MEPARSSYCCLPLWPANFEAVLNSGQQHAQQPSSRLSRLSQEIRNPYALLLGGELWADWTLIQLERSSRQSSSRMSHPSQEIRNPYVPGGRLWTDWTLIQPERVWDSIEIPGLRNANRGFDSFYKPEIQRYQAGRI